MEIITLSSEFQITIPDTICEALNIKPGEKLLVLSRAGRIEIIPIHPMKQMRGFLRGMDTTIERDNGS